MENMDIAYATENSRFIDILSSNIKNYKEIKKLFDILLESKNNSTSIIKKAICENRAHCLKYLDSEHNIVDSGIDFAFKTCVTHIHNIFLDYKKLINRTDIKEINSTLINSGQSNFILIGLALNNIFFYVKEKIFDCFIIDVTNFNDSYRKNMRYLNIFSIIFSILIFLFIVIYIFITISNYINPIKESSYRINCSFYYIKNYDLTTKRKIEHI